MDIGVCVASHIGDIGYISRAEHLGYSHAWLADSQMIWSDCYATLALVAEKTSSINIGTGVAITGTRPAAVNAAGIATINALAPGRTFFGVGAGNTAMRIMGLPPHRIAEYDRYLEEVKPLLSGHESRILHEGKSIPIKHIMPDRGFVNFNDPIPMYVSGFGPKSLALAGKHGDGAVMAFASSPAAMESIWLMIEEGARGAGKTINRNSFYTTALTSISVLDEGEAIDSPRIKQECGAMAMAALHYTYDQYRNFGHQPPNHLADIWGDYTRQIESFPEEKRHQRIHAEHNCWVLPEEEKFVTPATLEASCLIGTKDQLIEKLRALNDAGLDQVMILPAFDPKYEVLERVAKDIIPNI